MKDKKKIRVIITEDHAIVRQGLRLLLEQDEEILVIGEANNGSELLEMLAKTPADVVLMDISMPEVDGFEATEVVCKNFPETKVVVLSMVSNMASVQKILALGASGYLLKSTGKDELCAAIKLVASGTNYICGGLSFEMLEKAANQETLPAQEQKKAEQSQLSKREIEVLALIAEGFTNAEIADKLFTSKRTIETHRQNILEKTQAKNTANLIKYAIQHKIIE